MTNKPALNSVTEFMTSYVPKYAPLYPLFMGGAQKYNEEVGKLTFRRVESMGDLDAKVITPKDTEIKQVSVGEGSKVFKKFFKGNQYVISHLQAQEGVQQTISEVLDHHQRQFDAQFLTGEGSSNSTMVNNSLFWSADSNFLEESPATLASGDGQLSLFHSNIMTEATKADAVSGRKAIIFYGNGDVNLKKLFPVTYQAFKLSLAQSLGSNYSIISMPTPIVPASSHGYIIVNLDQVKLHYTKLPMLESNGSNDEKKYFWHNFLFGSCMLEVLAPNAVIKQPIVFS